jgi:tetratricopeptide (TPR) repeat protein
MLFIRFSIRVFMTLAMLVPRAATAQLVAPDVLAPVRDSLLPVPQPRLDDLEPAVTEHIREAQQKTAGVLASGSSSREQADAYGSLARVYHAYEFLDSAEPAYLNARRLASGNSEWPHLLGVLYQQTGRLDEAAEALAAARRLQPRDYAAAIHLGDVYMSLNRLVDAREQFQGVIDVFPAVARRGLGDVALRERKFAEAVEHYRAVLDRVPQADAMHYSLAMAYRGLGRIDEARAHLQRRGPAGVHVGDPVMVAVQSLVRGERAWVMRGRRAYEAGEFQAAAEAFTKALEAAPASVTARVNLGLSLSQLGDPTGAAEQFERALRLEADNRVARASLGILRARQGRDSQALDHLSAAFALAPGDAAVSRELTAVLLRLGRENDAIDVLTKARSFDPDDEDMLIGLSILLAKRERYLEAVNILGDANRRFPERAATATTLARLLASSPDVALRNGRRALEIATAVNDAEPSPAHGETIALALAELGRCSEALDWMKRAVASAERAKDPAEVARLGGEMAKYERAVCRP